MATTLKATFSISWSVRQRFPKIDRALQELMAGPMTTYIDPDDGHQWFQLPDPYGYLHFYLGENNIITKQRASDVVKAWRHFQKEP